MSRIIFGTGSAAREYIATNGVADVLCFVDNFPKDKIICGKPVYTFDKLTEIYSEHDVIIAARNPNVVFDIVLQLDKYSIPYTWMYEKGVSDALLHVYGRFPDIKFEVNPVESTVQWRSDATIKMLRNILCDKNYTDGFSGKKIDSWIYVQDNVNLAYMLGKIRKLPYVFAYSTYDVFKNYVIPLPDYHANIDDSIAKYSFIDLKKLASMPYEYNCAFWGGNINNNIARMCAYILGKQFPCHLHVIATPPSGMDKPISIQEQAKYKYLIDIQGYGWTDRLKILLQLGRVVLIQERAAKEWYFDELVPMKHYVPIKSDLSDLIDRIKWLEDNPDIYNKIARNMRDLADEIFDPSMVRILMKNMILKYGVDECG